MKIFTQILLALAFVSSGASALPDAPELCKVRVVLPRTKPNGKAWDAMGGKPDPYVVINDQSFHAFRCEDSFTCNFFTTHTGRMFIEVWDADINQDDFAGAAECRPGYKCVTDTGTTVTVQ